MKKNVHYNRKIIKIYLEVESVKFRQQKLYINVKK